MDDYIDIEDPIIECAKNVFGIDYLYPWQRLVVTNILDAVAGGDEERRLWAHQIVLLPTGAGKSLCFLLPAALLPGPSLIIYPLLALMSDQKRRMDSAGLEAVVFRGGQTPEEREGNFKRLQGGARVILANPEVLQSEALVDRLAGVGILHAAIDEAHCTCEWGDTFRPAYLTLGKILARLNVPVVTAFTATASEGVLRRTAEVLFDGDAHIVRSDSDRPNIRYYLRRAFAKQKAALLLAIQEEKPMIVFCGTRLKAEQTARLFSLYFGRDRVRFYHAGLERDEKKAVEQWFFPRDDGILCATCAFGMGVDKSDIRTVIHLEPPSTAEAYIQEAGRGGRDGKPSKAVLIWSDEDRRRFSAFEEGRRERALLDLAEKNTCRRQVLLDALGGEQAPCSGCDVCEGTAETSAADGDFVLAFFRTRGGSVTLSEAKGILQEQLNRRDSPRFGVRIWEHDDVSAIIDGLIQNRALLLGEGAKKDRVVGVISPDVSPGCPAPQRAPWGALRRIWGSGFPGCP
ncbi:MAG: RecQ family ATP-dependent DNA helicase [Spirochaetaceae bacterium]|jgi:ATP-dependent DNA helicase RecQ|nr:RecQ family ATP-dependent DNA helicase [Spirochaetaceae bacterium]